MFNLVSVEDNCPQLEHTLKSAVKAICMTSKLSHTAQKTVENVLGRKNYVLVTGGMTSLRRQLKTWAEAYHENRGYFDVVKV